jgi:DNA replication protein DnaC
MKAINLKSILQSYRKLEEATFNGYKSFFGIPDIKKHEFDTLECMCSEFNKVGDPILFEEYYVSYEIPQISREFDLLRFGDEFIINIELKSQSTEEKITKQLTRNQYYLSFLSKKCYCITYVADQNKFYTIEKNKFIELNLNEVITLIISQKLINIPDIDSLFNPSNYLVSPFNSTTAFVRGEYFLTSHQEEIKNKCLKSIKKVNPFANVIIGKAGTGKTLLTYDIAREAINLSLNVLIIHCGNINSGQAYLNQTHKWNIIHIKYLLDYEIKNFDLIVVDESQRIIPRQLSHVIGEAKKYNKPCIFSLDPAQCLKQSETNNNILERIKESANHEIHELTDKIRTNKEIADFITTLLDNTEPAKQSNKNNVELSYFYSTKDAKDHLETLEFSGWKIINYTPDYYKSLPYSRYKIGGASSTHDVIGQEFDKVVAVIDEFFYYNEYGKLDIKGYGQFYQVRKMLLQILTRTKLKLHVIIINNKEILDRCLEILRPKLQEDNQKPQKNMTS